MPRSPRSSILLDSLPFVALPEAGAPMPAPGLLRPARVHEVSGDGARTFAVALAATLEGAVLWVMEARERDSLMPQGLAGLGLCPSRLVLAHPTGRLAVLQVLEEALRSGAAPLVVGELDRAPDLTASRRLQLAAGTGGGRGLVLIPHGSVRGSAAETRWHCQPLSAARGEETPQLWDLVKNKRGRLGAWQVGRTGGRFHAISGPARADDVA